MRQRLAAVVAALCVAPLAAACSDDTSQARANANADTSPASLQGGAANAFNGGATAAGNAPAGASAPLATPVIHYPPEDSADDASGATAASAQPASNPG